VLLSTGEQEVAAEHNLLKILTFQGPSVSLLPGCDLMKGEKMVPEMAEIFN
jgi:hypothetical protein